MVARATLVLALLAASACGIEPKKTCATDAVSDVVTSVKLRGKDEADPERYECVDLHLASRLDATESSAGLNESFASSRPGVIPWTNVSYDEAAMACGRAGKFLCSGELLQLLVPFDTNPKVVVSPPVDALHPTTSDVDYPEQAKPLFATVRASPAFPDVVGNIPVWTGETEVLGVVQSGLAQVTSQFTPVYDRSFRHPLLGFRCCIDARLQSAFESFDEDPSFIREEVPSVPIATP